MSLIFARPTSKSMSARMIQGQAPKKSVWGAKPICSLTYLSSSGLRTRSTSGSSHSTS